MQLDVMQYDVIVRWCRPILDNVTLSAAFQR